MGLRTSVMWLVLAIALAVGIGVAWSGCTFQVAPLAGETGEPGGDPGPGPQPTAPPPDFAVAPDFAQPVVQPQPTDCRTDGCPSDEACVPDKHGDYHCVSSDGPGPSGGPSGR